MPGVDRPSRLNKGLPLLEPFKNQGVDFDFPFFIPLQREPGKAERTMVFIPTGAIFGARYL